MKKIPLSQGKFALVDDADFEWLSKWNWVALKRPSKERWQVARIKLKSDPDHYPSTVTMSRVILGLVKGEVADHISGDDFDNRRENLRKCTMRENSLNRGKFTKAASRYKGVHKQKDFWRARIRVNGKLYSLGCFDSEKEAATAYNEAATLHFGNFARLNAIGEEEATPLA